MPRVINFDRGSKRRLRAIRWTPRQLTGAAILFLLLVMLMVLVAMWDANKYAGLHLLRGHQAQSGE